MLPRRLRFAAQQALVWLDQASLDAPELLPPPWASVQRTGQRQGGEVRGPRAEFS